jgi:hypothetical protein
MVGDERPVWVFLVERALDVGSDLRLFWREADAVEAARTHLSATWPVQNPVTRAQVYEAIEQTNQLAGAEEYLVLGAFPVSDSN